MESTRYPSESTTSGILTTLGSTVGLAFGPSVIAVLTISSYIGSIEKEFGWSRVQVSLAFTIVAYMIVLMSPLQGVLVDRFGPRRVVLASIPLFSASLAALYFTPKISSSTTHSGPLCRSLQSGCGHWVICRR
jgi:MFS family permease